MFTFKKHYYLYVENSKQIDITKIRIRNKFSVIYRNYKKKEKVQDLLKFRNLCRSKNINFFVINSKKLSVLLNADGIYLSSHNKGKFYYNKIIIGSAHNYREICEKKRQGCKTIIVSRLFKTNYENKKSFLGLVRFNSFFGKNYVALGGIRTSNLNKLRILQSDFIAILSEIKKKPAKIISRLF